MPTAIAPVAGRATSRVRIAILNPSPSSPSRWSTGTGQSVKWSATRSEEHTSELQSRPHLVCRLLLEKKKQHTPVLQAAKPASLCGPIELGALNLGAVALDR